MADSDDAEQSQSPPQPQAQQPASTRWRVLLQRIVSGVVAVAAIIIAAYGVVYIGVNYEDILAPDDFPAVREGIAARNKHISIATRVNELCRLKDNFQDALRAGDPIVRSAFLIDVGGPTATAPKAASANAAAPPPSAQIHVPNFAYTLLYLSGELVSSRSRLATDVNINDYRRVWFQWVIVGLGAITTIMISIKSMANDRSAFYSAVGVLALIFSALSTAASSLNAFYTPGDTYLRSTKTLAQLQNLHAEIGEYVATSTTRLCDNLDAEDPKNGPPDERRRIQAQMWSQYLTIINVVGAGQGDKQKPQGDQGS